MLINKVKSFINFIIETVEYCLYGLIRVIIAPFKAVSIYKDYVAMKQYHEDMSYVEVPASHKHDNYQSQIDMLNRRIEDFAEGISMRINTNHQEHMKSIEGLNPIILNPDTVTERLDNLEKHVNEGILKEIRDLGHIEADRLGMEVAVEEKELVRDEKYKWKREQQLIEAKIKEQAEEDAIEW